MAVDLSDSVTVNVETISLGEKEHLIKTGYGSVSVAVFGDLDKPALVTYPDVALNYMSCFRGLFFCPEAFSLLLHNFCIYHISPPGHELGAALINPDDPVLSVDDLADQIAEVLDYFGLGAVMCMGVTAGAYILSLFAMKYTQRALGLILVSPLCKAPSWTEWLYNKLGAALINPDDPVLSVDDLADQIAEVLDYFGLGAVMCMGVTAGAYILSLFAMKYTQRALGLILVSPLCKAPSWTEWLYNKVMSNLLYFYGTCSVAKELLLMRYFSKEVRSNSLVPDSDIVQACRRLLDERQSPNVLRFLEAIQRRPDITEGLKKLQCRSLIFVGENSPFHAEALHMTSKLDRRHSALVEVQACGSIVTEEQPHAMLIPMEYFLMGYGFYRPSQFNVSPRSPLSPTSISPELFSPESMGLKLKPIKTRISMEV